MQVDHHPFCQSLQVVFFFLLQQSVGFKIKKNIWCVGFFCFFYKTSLWVVYNVHVHSAYTENKTFYGFCLLTCIENET